MHLDGSPTAAATYRAKVMLRYKLARTRDSREFCQQVGKIRWLLSHFLQQLLARALVMVQQIVRVRTDKRTATGFSLMQL